MSRGEPFGYRKDEQGNLELVPQQYEALKQAKYYMDQGCTYQSVRDWLVSKTGRTISTQGLLKALRYNGRTEASNKDEDTASNP